MQEEREIFLEKALKMARRGVDMEEIHEMLINEECPEEIIEGIIDETIFEA